MKLTTILLLATTLCQTSSILAKPERRPSFEPNGKPAKQPADSVAKWTGFMCGDWYGRYDRDFPTEKNALESEISLKGWRGERVHAKLILSSENGFKQVHLIQPKFGKMELLRYVSGDGILYADIVEPNPPTYFPGVTRPILYTFDIPANTTQTSFKDTLKVFINGKEFSLPIKIEVEKKTLPAVKNWKFFLDFWQHPDSIARWHDVPMWSKAHIELMKPYMEVLADMGQKVITATLIKEAWNGQTYDAFDSMIGYTKTQDGSWKYDYSKFDAWVEMMLSVGIDKQISCYTLVSWSLIFPYFDEKTGQIVSPKLQPGSPEYEAFWGPFLTDFVKHLKTKGWLKITKLAMDERPDHLLKPALAIAKKYAPELQYVAACDRPSQMNLGISDVSYTYKHSEELVKHIDVRKKNNMTTTFYVCLNPQRPNTFLHSDPAESEWLCMMAANYDFDGILRWAWNSWVKNPLVTTDFTSWPTGDTSLIYPGPRLSMRIVHFRDGVENYEKLRLMKEKPKALETFTVKRGGEKGIHAEDLRNIIKTIQ